MSGRDSGLHQVKVIISDTNATNSPQTVKVFLHLGLEEGRVQFSWVSAAEGGKFSQVVDDVTRDIKKSGPPKRFVKKVRSF